MKALISKFAEHNILAFEFRILNKRKKPTLTVSFSSECYCLKRQQMSFRREIFTLIHELGHFLLNEEEIEKLEIEHLANDNLSSIERWCNDFSFHFYW